MILTNSQIDHYFSEENLATDRFLLKKMRGHENLPIPVHVIHDFQKMKPFTFEELLKALGRSRSVNIIEKDKVFCMQRKTPFITVDKKKSKSKSTKRRGTGYEEYFADAPLTPAEFEEEEDLYSL